MNKPTRFVASILLPIVVFSAGPVAADSPSLEVRQLDVPAAAGSRSPNLAAGNGYLVLSWIEPQGEGHRLRYSILEGIRWSEPRTVAAGNDWFVNWADFPSVVPLGDSRWAAHWLVTQPAAGYAYDVHLSLSVDGGRSWSDPMLPHDDGTPTEHGFVTLFPQDGGVGLVWLDGRNTAGGSHGAGGHAGMTLRYGKFAGDFTMQANAEIDGLVCDCCQTDVAISDSGPVVVYRNRTDEEVRDIFVMRYADGQWQPPRPVADDGWVIAGCPVNGPTVVADGAEVAVAWFTGADNRSRVQMSRSSDSGATFGRPIEISDGKSFGHTGVAFLPNGELAVSWLCQGTGRATRVCLRWIDAKNEAGPVHVVSGVDTVQALNVPQLAPHDDAVIVAWTAERDGRAIIRSARATRSGVATAD
jgi:hypothetical protein